MVRTNPRFAPFDGCLGAQSVVTGNAGAPSLTPDVTAELLGERQFTIASISITESEHSVCKSARRLPVG
jgi:hypothetical protein